MNRQKGISQILVMVIMLVLAIALPITTKLVQQSQENRSKATTFDCTILNKDACLEHKSECWFNGGNCYNLIENGFECIHDSIIGFPGSCKSGIQKDMYCVGSKNDCVDRDANRVIVSGEISCWDWAVQICEYGSFKSLSGDKWGESSCDDNSLLEGGTCSGNKTGSCTYTKSTPPPASTCSSDCKGCSQLECSYQTGCTWSWNNYSCVKSSGDQPPITDTLCKCGTAASNTPVSSKPTSNLCPSGETASPVTDAGASWKWTCSGSSCSPKSCSVPKTTTGGTGGTTGGTSIKGTSCGAGYIGWQYCIDNNKYLTCGGNPSVWGNEQTCPSGTTCYEGGILKNVCGKYVSDERCTPSGGADKSGVINDQWSCAGSSVDQGTYIWYYNSYYKLDDVSRSADFSSSYECENARSSMELQGIEEVDPSCKSEKISGSVSLSDCEKKGGTCSDGHCCVPASVGEFKLGECEDRKGIHGEDIKGSGGQCVATSTVGGFDSGKVCTTGGITNVRYSCVDPNQICCMPANPTGGSCNSAGGVCIDIVSNVGKNESGLTCTPRSGSYYGGTNNGTTNTNYSCGKVSEICCIEKESSNKCVTNDCGNTCHTKELCEAVGCLWEKVTTGGDYGCVPKTANYCHEDGYCNFCTYKDDCQGHLGCTWNDATGTCGECIPDCSCAKDTPVGSGCFDGCGHYSCTGTKTVTPVSVCTAGAKQCSGTKVQTCNASGTVWTDTTDCGTLGCNSTTKTCNTCISGQQKCTATNRYFTCNSGQWSTSTTNCPSGQICTNDAIGTNVCRATDYTAPSLNLFFAVSGVKAVNPCFGDLSFKVNVAKDGQDGMTGNVTATVVANKFNSLGDQVFKISNFALDNTYALTDKIKVFVSGKKTLATLYGKNNQVGGFGALNSSQILVSSLSNGAILDFSGYPVLNGDVGQVGQLGVQDGVVNAADFGHMKNQWGKTCSDGQNLEADLNGDCRVDTFDLQILKNANAEQYAQKTF